jgi:hypothetical protein
MTRTHDLALRPGAPQMPALVGLQRVHVNCGCRTDGEVVIGVWDEGPGWMKSASRKMAQPCACESGCRGDAGRNSGVRGILSAGTISCPESEICSILAPAG